MELTLVRRIAALAATALVLITATAAGAKPVIWRCEITDPPEPLFVPPEYVISYDKSSGEALAYDGLIKHVKKAPIPAKVSKKGDRLFFTWVLTAIPSKDNTRYSSRYTISINEQTLAMKVDEKLLGYDNHPISLAGTCRVLK